MNGVTPGPWEAGPAEGLRYMVRTRHGVGGFIIECYRGEADARLVSAAPDLLAALEAIEAYWEYGDPTADPDVWEQSRAAIAKARGHEPAGFRPRPVGSPPQNGNSAGENS